MTARERTNEPRPGPWHSVDLEHAMATGDVLGTLTVGEVVNQFADADHRGLMLAGDRRRILAMNAAAREMLAYDGALPRPVGEVSHDVEVEFAVGDALHDRRPVWHDSFAPNPDRILRYHLIPVVDTAGMPVLVMLTVEDVTRLRHLETVRRDFVANVSHELRTPIASINLLVETLQRGAIDDREAAQRFLHRIEVETQAMAHLVGDLLELSRLETGALTLTLSQVDLENLIRDVVVRLAPAAEEKQVSVTLDVRHTLPPIEGDRERLEQVLMNLIHNAIKFTPSGGRVTIRAARQGRGVAVDVVDTGVGMDPEQASRIFERFYKVDRGRNRGDGAGLGLAIAKHLLELHGTSLHVVSEVGRGSKFSFALPVAG